MVYIFAVIFALIGFAGVGGGVAIFLSAASAIHEIEAGVCFAVGLIGLGLAVVTELGGDLRRQLTEIADNTRRTCEALEAVRNRTQGGR